MTYFLVDKSDYYVFIDFVNAMNTDETKINFLFSEQYLSELSVKTIVWHFVDIAWKG